MNFSDGADELIKATEEDLVGTLTVDQVYAHIQEVSEHFHHPEGGIALALATSLLTKHPEMLHKLAGAVLDGQEAMRNAMAECMEDLNWAYYELAPREFNDLRASGSPEVLEGGQQVYHRPPNVHRLSEEELRAKDEVRRLGF